MGKNNTLEPVKKGIYFGSASKSLIEVSKSAVEPDAQEQFIMESRNFAIWGADNDYPQKIINENMEDTTSAGALRFKINAHYGLGPFLYKKEIKGKSEVIIPQLIEHYQEIDDFFFANDIENFLQSIIEDYEWFNACHIQYIQNKAGNKIVGLNATKTVQTRSKKLDPKTGKLPGFVLSGYWPTPKDEQKVAVPAFNRLDPFAIKAGAIYKHTIPSPDRIYYITPKWHSNMRWIRVTKKIPDWIGSNIENSMVIKYHIEVPEQYFLSLFPKGDNESEEAWKKRLKTEQEDLFKKMDDYLSGEKNVGKAFYSRFAVDENGKPLPGWKINVLDIKTQHEAYLPAYSTGAAAVATAHGVAPSLSGLILANSLGGNSAADVREQFNNHVQLHTVIPRQTTTEWFNMIMRYNKWDKDPKMKGLHLGYRNIVLQTLDENKSGFQKQSEATPTTDQKN